jgi:hypothetical protein
MSASLARQITSVPLRADTPSSAAAQAGNPLFTYENFRRHYELGPEEKWQICVLEKLIEFTNLPQGWDGYGAHPFKWDAGMFALTVLSRIMLPRTPAPQVVPSPMGGVQIEWHLAGVDLEFHVAAPYDCELWFEDHRTGKMVSTPVTDDLSGLQDAVRTLSAR